MAAAADGALYTACLLYGNYVHLISMAEAYTALQIRRAPAAGCILFFNQAGAIFLSNETKDVALAHQKGKRNPFLITTY